MTPSRNLQLKFLLAAWEESDLCIAEAELNSEEFSDLTSAQKRANAISTVQLLLSRGWISLYRYKWPRGDWETVASKDYEKILSNPESWGPPGEGEWAYCVYVSEQGKQQLEKPG